MNPNRARSVVFFLAWVCSLGLGPLAQAGDECGHGLRRVLYRQALAVGFHGTATRSASFDTRFGGDGVRHVLRVHCPQAHRHASIRGHRCPSPAAGASVVLNGVPVFEHDGRCSSERIELALHPVGGPPNTIVTTVAGRPGAWIDVAVVALRPPGNSCNVPPVADAGADQTLPVGAVAVLDGSGSSDPDGDPLSYAWSLASAPAGSVAALSDPTAIDPRFTLDRPGRYVVELVASDGRAASAPDTVTISTENSAPVADAGPDQAAFVGVSATLDGSGSSDADGDPLSFAWSVVSRPAGSTATLDDPTAVRPALVPDVAGVYELRLVVNDSRSDSAPDTALVTTENTAPVADAGPDQTIALGAEVTLDGSGSTDVDGDALAYAWSLLSVPSGSTASLNDASAVRPRFVADRPGAYVAQLQVDDGLATSAADTVRITTENSAPVADAGPDQTVAAGQLVSLDGSASSDPDGDLLTLSWSFTSRPAGSTAAVSDATSPAPWFTADRPGAYVVQLVVNDGALSSAPDSVTISTTNSVPVAGAGPDQSDVPVGAAVSLDGSASFDADGHPLSYRWSLLAKPAGSAAALFDETTAIAELVPDVSGDYVVQLIVNDGFVDSAPDAATVATEALVPNVVSIEASDPDAAEAGLDPASFTVRRDGDTSAPLTVFLALAGTASGPDYDAFSLTPTIPAGADSITIGVTPRPDNRVEGPETIALTISPNLDYVVGTPDSATVTIADDPPVVSVTASDADAAEAGPDPGSFRLTRAGGDLAAALEVGLTLAGTAANGVDYVTLPGSVTIPAGSLEAVVVIEPLDDALLEGPETAVLTLGAGPGYEVGALDAATITIQDDERPAVSVTVADGTAGEAGLDPGSFSISRTGPTTAPLTVFYAATGTATQGVDYEALAGSVTIPIGSASAAVVVAPIDDDLVEGAEGVILTLGADPAYVVMTPGIALLNIADDDLGVVTIVAADPDASEAGLDAATFTLSRTGDTSAALLVNLAKAGTATNGSDYTGLGGAALVATIPAGASSTTLTLTPLADNLVEGDETVVLTVTPALAYVVGAPAEATATIHDDAPVVTLDTSDPDAAEAGLEPGAFVLMRRGGDANAALTVAVSVGGTAIANRDYAVLSGVVSIPAGQTSVAIALAPLPDNLVEGPETVALTLLAPPTLPTYLVGSPSGGTVTIADDAPVVEVVVTDPDAAEAGLDPGTVAFTRTGGDLAVALNVFFTKSGTAANGADYASLGGGVSLLVIAAGQPSAQVTIAPLADNLVEGPETAVLTLAPNAAYVIGSTESGTVTIADDPAVVTVVATDPHAAEAGPDPGTFTFTRSGGNLAAALNNVTFILGGTAGNVFDYATLSSQVDFAAGQAAVTLTITPVDDASVEGEETVILTLDARPSYLVGMPGSATMTMADND